MAAIYTNVSEAKHKTTVINNVKSVTANEELNLLLSQADGARGQVAVGELENTFAITVEAEETAQILAGIVGFVNRGTFTWKAQLETAPGTVKTFTITNTIVTGISRSTDQANPNGVTITIQQVGNDSVLTIV